jgi:hypothetical protein
VLLETVGLYYDGSVSQDPAFISVRGVEHACVPGMGISDALLALFYEAADFLCSVPTAFSELAARREWCVSVADQVLLLYEQCVVCEVPFLIMEAAAAEP